MKNHLLGVLAISLITNYFALNTCKAQAPQGIPYQAIARNASGAAIANTAVKVRFSIRDSIATGPVRYQETHSPTTSALGLFSVNVGMGTVVSGTFSGINWGKNAKFLQVELDPAGGSSYTDLGTTQMMSVPYALQANSIKMRTSATGDTLYTGGGNYVIIPGISAANPSTGNPNWNGTTVSDIDGNVYNTVTIGSQVWMKENLKVSRYRNGDVIPTNLSDAEWRNATAGACGENSNFAAHPIVGKIYNGFAASDPRGLCPIGWHLPADSEWKVLETFLGMPAWELDLLGERGGVQNVGGKLKALSSLWVSPNTNATNEVGFNGLPAGYRYGTDGTYGNYGINLGGDTGWWCNSGELFRGIDYTSGYFHRVNTNKKGGVSVRCLKD